MARLAIRATGDRSTRESVIVGDGEVSAVYWVGNRPMFTVSMSYPDVLEVHNYADGTIREIHAHGCAICGKQAIEYYGSFCGECNDKKNKVLSTKKCCVCSDIATCGDFCKRCSDNIPF